MIPVLLIAALLDASSMAPVSGPAMGEVRAVGDTAGRGVAVEAGMAMASPRGAPHLRWGWGEGTGAAQAAVLVPGGTFLPPTPGRADPWPSPPFRLARTPVTVGDYLAFVTDHPHWRRSAVPALFADGRYLADWAGDLDPGLRTAEDRD